MLNKIHTLLGGYMAEKHFLGPERITTGCGDDLKKATDIAYAMVRHFGMDEDLGLASCPKDKVSEGSNEKIDKAVQSIIKVNLINSIC